MIEHTVEIDAPAALVFAMFTDEALLVEWMVVAATIERQPGGLVRWTYANGDVMEGRFVEIAPPHRLVFTYGWATPIERAIPPGSTTVEVTLLERDGRTTVRVVHTGLPSDAEDAHQRGWRHFLPRLASTAARRQPHEARPAAGVDE